jgi:hypothetical protein
MSNDFSATKHPKRSNLHYSGKAVRKRLGEACKLVEVGFEYVCDVDNTKVLRKGK